MGQLHWTQPGPDQTWWGTPPNRWAVARVIPRTQSELEAEGPHSVMPRVVRRYWLVVFLAEDAGEFDSAEEGKAYADGLWDAHVAERRR